MDIDGRTVWQQAAGNNANTPPVTGNQDISNYAQWCLDSNVILRGPGEHGSWPECKCRLDAGTRTNLRRFCEDMEHDDIVVLHVGTSSVYGVGRIVGEYEWCLCFDNGPRLGHVRRVSWLWKAKGKPMKFETYALKTGRATQILFRPDADDRPKAADLKLWLESLEPPDTGHP